MCNRCRPPGAFLCYWAEWLSEGKRPHHPLWAEHGLGLGPTGNISGTLLAAEYINCMKHLMSTLYMLPPNQTVNSGRCVPNFKEQTLQGTLGGMCLVSLALSDVE